MIHQARKGKFEMPVNGDPALILVLATIVAFVPAVGFSAKDVAAMEGSKAFDAHATAFSYFFDDGDMDFHFGNLVLGSTVNHGAEIGEAFYAASRIKDGDAAGWQDEWYKLARRVEALIGIAIGIVFSMPPGVGEPKIGPLGNAKKHC